METSAPDYIRRYLQSNLETRRGGMAGVARRTSEVTWRAGGESRVIRWRRVVGPAAMGAIAAVR